MGGPVTKWISDDGVPFEDEQSMILHELALIDAKEIELFVQQYKERKRREYASVLSDWQKYQRQNQPLGRPVFNPEDRRVQVGAEFTNAFGIFNLVAQGPELSEPAGYNLDDEDAAIEESFKRATKL